ncbi:MAG: polysaccharide biosynthesis protein [Phycisphaerales bacterium]
MAATTVIIIGQLETCIRLERVLDLLDAQRPISLGWVLCNPQPMSNKGLPILGTIDELEAVLARRLPSQALLSLPAVMHEEIQSIRTRLRRGGVIDRFLPTLEDQLAGVGPRSLFQVNVEELLDRTHRVVDRDRLQDLVHNRRVLITGAGGSIGSELARITARFEPGRLVLVERSENALFEIDRQIARINPALSRRAVLHDVVEHNATRALLCEEQPHLVLHAAAHKHVPMMENHPAAAISNNVFGTRSIADAAHAAGVERFVMISSDKAVNPTSIMGATKRLAEIYIQHLHAQSQTAFSMVRFGNVLGSSGSVIDVWSRQVADGGPLTVTHPAMTRYFMTIPEAATLVMHAAAMTRVGRERGCADVFVLDMGEPINVLELSTRFARLSGLEPVLDHSPKTGKQKSHAAGRIGITLTGPRPGEKLHEELARDVEALVPTEHPDIQVWRLPQPRPADVHAMLRKLDRDHLDGSSDGGSSDVPASDLAELIRSLVPEMQEAVAT